VIYELSKDHARAWELIQQGDRLACEVDCRLGRDVGSAYNWKSRVMIINAKSVNYAWLADEENTFDLFAKRCTELNIEFYLPLNDNMIVISAELFEEVARKVIKKSIGDPLDELIKKVESIL
jgi:hypothetical protein